jgi:hypothetical protein
VDYAVEASYLEIYNEHISDLLAAEAKEPSAGRASSTFDGVAQVGRY